MSPRLVTILIFVVWLAFIVWVEQAHPGLLTY